MDYQSFKNAVIAEAEALGIAEYELYYQSGSETSVGVFRDEINEFSSSEGGGVCFRCIVGSEVSGLYGILYIICYISTLLIWAMASSPFSIALSTSKTLSLHPAMRVTSSGTSLTGASPYPARSMR